jgi:3-oxoacyl-[acyl-carrier protein] reductase
VGALPIRADVSVEADVKRMVQTVIAEFGDYNALVNNAGYGYFATLIEQDLDQFNRLFLTNVTGAMLVARESARYFISRQRGNIINISSTAESKGFAGGTAYAASKFALTGMTECWRAELRQHNIRVMQINPSEVLTDFFQAAGLEQKASDRKLRPQDIAHAIVSALQIDDRGFILAEIRRMKYAMKAHHALHARRRAARQVQHAQSAEAIADCPDSIRGDHGVPLGRCERREDAPAEHRTVIQKWLDEVAVIV